MRSGMCTEYLVELLVLITSIEGLGDHTAKTTNQSVARLLVNKYVEREEGKRREKKNKKTTTSKSESYSAWRSSCLMVGLVNKF